MSNNVAYTSRRARRFRVALSAFALLAATFALAACGRGESDARRGLVIVNSPAAGEVRRVLVREGMTVEAGTPLVEIAVRTEVQQGAPPQAKTEDPLKRAGRQVGAANAGIEAARAEAVRAEVEVQRLTPLVASGDASQAQLDGARAEYERAQRRLQEAQSAAANAQSGLVAARREPQTGVPAPVVPTERIVAVEATSAGTVGIVSARVGDRVTAGQPLATLRAAR
ncbi:MAG TPA: biotin/lipoyl-containing protein [Pyrinomonadaceae bacterium]|jgi:multidrug resistance efflux pump